MCLNVRSAFYNEAQRSSIRAVADFKAISCPPPQKFIKCTDLQINAVPAIALIHCVCPAWASGIEDIKIFQRVEVPYVRG
jgi:hypothetical protein